MSNLLGGADTTLALHLDCGTELAFDDDGAGNLASRIDWVALQAGPHDVRVREYADEYANGKGYAIAVTCIANCGGGTSTTPTTSLSSTTRTTTTIPGSTSSTTTRTSTRSTTTITGCSQSLLPTSLNFSAQGGSGAFNVDSSLVNCGWSASTSRTWIHILNGGFGTGDGAVSYTVDPNTTSSARTGTISVGNRTHSVQQGRASNCPADGDTLCLNSDRFRVEVTWRNYANQTGSGQAVPFRNDSGLFWFFGPSNIEMLIKVINACGFNQRYWVYAAATTDVEYTLTVTDTVANTSRQYYNTLGNRAAAITDSSAFATCGSSLGDGQPMESALDDLQILTESVGEILGNVTEKDFSPESAERRGSLYSRDQ